MDNDEGSSGYWTERAEEALSNSDDADDSKYALADELKDSHQENAPEVTGVYSDLLNAALGEVDWYEIAESLLSDAKDNVEAT